MSRPEHVIEIRIRYGETDRMGTYYYGAAADWFETARTELLRSIGLPYSEMESRGLFLPVIVMHAEYVDRADYDDPLRISVSAEMQGRIRLRCPVHIINAETGADVCKGYTVHAIVGRDGRPMKPPHWFLEAIGRE